MSKQRSESTAAGGATASRSKSGSGSKESGGSIYESISSPATRETIESIVVAVILAFLFRGFIAEAFVIPTGSMAPTLQGSHKDVTCPQCFYEYRTSASSENADSQNHAIVVTTTCPICRFVRSVDEAKRNDATFTGDRILVSKFAYELGEPQRWDVIVFKFPGNAKQNYIKRLVGLPHESIRIHHGDVYIQQPGEQQFQIARKEDHRKLLAMLQLVDDTQHISTKLAAAGWPSRWQPWVAELTARPWTRTCENDTQGFYISSTNGPAWFRYRHFVPDEKDWRYVDEGLAPERIMNSHGQLIADFYAYNGYVTTGHETAPNGQHWVGDLAAEYNIRTESESGAVLLDLVEGGVHFQCRIDLSDGKAELSIDDNDLVFTGAANSREKRTAQTAVVGAGKYALRFANVDDQLRLWVNDRLVEFDGPTTYERGRDLTPQWTPADPLDLAPAGIAADGCDLHVQRARLYRDVYYVASLQPPDDSDYSNRPWRHADLIDIFRDPERWSETGLFESRRTLNFDLAADQFFPMGDNSPQSRDARVWVDDYLEEHSVERRMLTGKALLIYWPHAWKTPIPFVPLPNFGRMGLIR